MKHWSEMKYDREWNCWIIKYEEGEYRLHFGDWCYLLLGKTSVPCRLDEDQEWFVVIDGVRFYLHTEDTYKVET